METDEREPVIDRQQRTFKVEGPWKGPPRTVIVAADRVVASDHKPWLGFHWRTLLLRLDRPGLVIRSVEPLIDREGRTPVWLSLEELAMLKKALEYLLLAGDLDLDDAELATQTLMEVKRVVADVRLRLNKDRDVAEAPAD